MKDKSVVVLCRGKSLDKIKELGDKEFDVCMIVNDFKREVQHDYVRDFLKKQKRIIHYVCRETFAVLPKELYDEFNIEFVYLNVLAKEYYGASPYPGQARLKIVLDKMGVPSKHLEESILEYSEPRDPSELRLPGFPTMGVLTTCHVASCLGYEDVTVMGLDFYEGAYLTVCSSTLTKEAPKKSGIDKAPRMKNFLAGFMEKFPNTKFTFYTYSTFNPGFENVVVK